MYPFPGMHRRVPTGRCFALTGFQARGGTIDVHSDGWRIAFFQEPASASFGC
mgnify:CR=1 FL=1